MLGAGRVPSRHFDDLQQAKDQHFVKASLSFDSRAAPSIAMKKVATHFLVGICRTEPTVKIFNLIEIATIYIGFQ